MQADEYNYWINLEIIFFGQPPTHMNQAASAITPFSPSLQKLISQSSLRVIKFHKTQLSPFLFPYYTCKISVIISILM